MCAVGQRNIKLHRFHLRRQLGDQLGERNVEHQHAVAGVLHDPAELIGKQTRVQRVIDRADAGNAVPRLHMARGVPGQRGDTVAELDAVRVERSGHLARALGDRAVIGAFDGAFHTARYHFALGVIERGVIDDLVDQERPVLHQPQHARFPLAVLPIIETRRAGANARAASEP